jgi:hypothetical protein
MACGATPATLQNYTASQRKLSQTIPSTSSAQRPTRRTAPTTASTGAASASQRRSVLSSKTGLVLPRAHYHRASDCRRGGQARKGRTHSHPLFYNRLQSRRPCRPIRRRVCSLLSPAPTCLTVTSILRQRGFFENVAPVNFNTIATPHLGLPRYPSLFSSLASVLGPRLLSRTGEQFYCADKWSASGRPLLEVMADPGTCRRPDHLSLCSPPQTAYSTRR